MGKKFFINLISVNMNIVKTRKIWFSASVILMFLSILLLIMWGLKPAIDFTGGSLLEIKFIERPNNNEIRSTLSEFDLGSITIQPVEDNNIIIKTKEIDEETHDKILNKITGGFPGAEEERFDSVGAVIGHELQRKAVYSIIFVLLAIIAYIAYAFRKISKPVQSWKYGIIAVIALLHDILIVMGIFTVLGHYYNIEVGLSFVAALLTILGYSVNNTIVVFDRTRENLHKLEGEFSEIVNTSINETVARSINTTLTTLVVLGAVYFFGGVTIQYFVLALILGIIIGTYSSLFITSPLLVEFYRLGKRA